MKRKGKIANVRTKDIDGYSFKSHLEYYCYIKLKEADLAFEYEKEKFTIIQGFEFKNKSFETVKRKGEKLFDNKNPLIRPITYTPDFTNLKDGWIIECKGFPNDVWPIRWKLFKKYITDNDLSYNLYVPRNKKQVEETIELIKGSKNESANK